MQLVISGATEAGRQLQAASQSGLPAMAIGLYREAEQILTAAKQIYVPVKDGHLRGSGFVEPPVMSETAASVTVGFGGPAAPYAVIVHEDLTKRHPVGQAKYLEIPLRARLQGMPAVLKQRVDNATRQALQRLAKVEQNLAMGRPVNYGMPLFR